MPRVIIILIFGMCILGSGCRTYSPETLAVWHKYRMVKPGMTRSQVFAVEPPAAFTTTTIGEGEMACWMYGFPFADEDYANMDVVFGKDGRVVRVDREIGHGHTPHDTLTVPPHPPP